MMPDAKKERYLLAEIRRLLPPTNGEPKPGVARIRFYDSDLVRAVVSIGRELDSLDARLSEQDARMASIEAKQVETLQTVHMETQPLHAALQVVEGRIAVSDYLRGAAQSLLNDK